MVHLDCILVLRAVRLESAPRRLSTPHLDNAVIGSRYQAVADRMPLKAVH